MEEVIKENLDSRYDVGRFHLGGVGIGGVGKVYKQSFALDLLHVHKSEFP